MFKWAMLAGKALSASTVAAHAQLLLDDILVRQDWLE